MTSRGCLIFPGILSAFMAFGFFASALEAQVPSRVTAFRTADITKEGEIFTYRFELRGPDRPNEEFGNILLDVTIPATEQAPRITGTRGSFLFDAISEFHGDFLYSHPSLFIGTPDNWMASIGRQGFLSWGSSKYSNQETFGVRAQQVLGGFELRSRGIPSLRRARAIPTRSLEGEAVLNPEEGEPQVDSTWVLADTYVLAPGWLPEQVTPEFLRLQVTNACDGLLTDRCTEYGALAGGVEEAFVSRSPDRMRLALARFQEAVSEDRVLDVRARRAFEEALTVLRGATR